MKKTIKPLVIIAIVLFAVGIIAFILVFNGIIQLNFTADSTYQVRGVDVSSYQGEIDWATFSAQDIDFAFIKATEGSSFVDTRFSYNYSEAQKHGIAVGAYHFFSYDSKGSTQAENFISNVQPFEGMLPPVIDVEFYGDKKRNPPDREDVDTQLKTMLSALEEHYGLKPIIYATERSYEMFLSGDYADYDIWIRNVITKPALSDGREWTFWQYTNRERLDGYKGKERFIDVNVFSGSEEDFLLYPRYISEKALDNTADM